jgi:hypothetical protein
MDTYLWRKISGETRSERGRRCRDTVASLKKTCRKLGISCWDDLHERIGQVGAIPPCRRSSVNEPRRRPPCRELLSSYDRILCALVFLDRFVLLRKKGALRLGIRLAGDDLGSLVRVYAAFGRHRSSGRPGHGRKAERPLCASYSHPV